MLHFVFLTYVIALIAFAMALWAVLEVREMKKNDKRKTTQRRIQQITQPTNTVYKSTAKGHWD